MRKQYLNKKKIRQQNKEESIKEEIRTKSNNSIPSDSDKTEDKISNPAQSKSEQSSSTLSAKDKSKVPHIFSSKEKKDVIKDKTKLIQKNKEKEIKIQNTDEKIAFLQKKLDDLQKAHELRINNLEKELKESKKQNDNLQKKIGKLDVQIEELNDFYFSGKLRKLLKRLIEYIIKNYYYSYMKTSPSTKRIYFVKAPRLSFNLKWAKDNEIIDALNRILALSFSNAKSKDLVIHFFEKKATRDSSYKKIYSVFNDEDEFFTYFKINGNDKIILKEIIPKDYLTIIDNASSDISLKELINVVRNIKIEEKVEKEDF